MNESLAEKMMRQLNYAFNLVRRERQSPEMRGGGVRRGQGQLLHVLLQKDSASQTELSELLHIRPASLGELVYKLERKGYVNRRPNQNDKRRVDVSLTTAGRAKAEEIVSSRQHLAADIFSGLTPTEQQQFAGLLDKFVATLAARVNYDGSTDECKSRHRHHCEDAYGDEGPRCKDSYEHGGDMGFDWQTPREE